MSDKIILTISTILFIAWISSTFMWVYCKHMVSKNNQILNDIRKERNEWEEVLDYLNGEQIYSRYESMSSGAKDKLHECNAKLKVEKLLRS